jgi:hypothetical protein
MTSLVTEPTSYTPLTTPTIEFLVTIVRSAPIIPAALITVDVAPAITEPAAACASLALPRAFATVPHLALEISQQALYIRIVVLNGTQTLPFCVREQRF